MLVWNQYSVAKYAYWATGDMQRWNIVFLVANYRINSERNMKLLDKLILVFWWLYAGVEPIQCC